MVVWSFSGMENYGDVGGSLASSRGGIEWGIGRNWLSH